RADAPNLTKGRSMSASSGIWSLVSGFPGQKRGNRLLAMFQAYLDESTSNPVHEGVFVMAGWISTAEKWAVFSDEWQELLDYRSAHYRKIDYFHWNEMRSDRDKERIPWFYRVIEKHAIAAISVVVDMPAVNRVFKETDWPREAEDLEIAKNPYSIAFSSTLWALLRSQRQLGIDSPIDFIFDETSNKVQCMQGWD